MSFLNYLLVYVNKLKDVLSLLFNYLISCFLLEGWKSTEPYAEILDSN